MRDAVTSPEHLYRISQLGGAKIVCRGVDEVARERHALGDAGKVIALQFGGHLELAPPLPGFWEIHWETRGD